MKAAAYWQALVDAYAQHPTDDAEAMSRYMRHRFSFFGIKTPDRKALEKAFYAAHGYPDDARLAPALIHLWRRPERECQYTAVDLFRKKVAKLDPTAMELCQQLITRKSWWDTVDLLAANVAGPLCKNHPALIDSHIRAWRAADDFWLRRGAILFQLKYKAGTDEALLFEIVREQADSDEFFIQKAIGWALREYAKTAPDAVRSFVDHVELRPLSRREALKRL